MKDYYREIGELSPEHEISLVQNEQTHTVAVKKVLHVYNRPVFETLYRSPIPHTPRIELLYEENGQLTVIEEYISGKTIADLLQEEGTFSENRIINYVQQLCIILDHIHSLNPPIIHRDIKPSNIIISPSGELFLLDFNAAKNYSAEKSYDTTLLGTHGYAAPEQYGFGVSGIQTDIFAVGVLMNEMLTGEPVHECTINSILAPIINRCTELMPERRFQTAGELSTALQMLSVHEASSPQKVNSLLPPGFRTGNMSHSILAIMGYAGILYFTITLQVENASPARLFLERSAFFIICIGLIFFTCNYCDIQKRIPFCQHKNPLVRGTAILVVNGLIFFLVLFILAIIENVAGMV